MMRYMYNMMGWSGGYGMMDGGVGLVTTLLVWAVLVLLAVYLWKQVNK